MKPVMILILLLFILLSCPMFLKKTEMIYLEGALTSNRLMIQVPFYYLNLLEVDQEIYFLVNQERFEAKITLLYQAPMRDQKGFYLIEAITFKYDSYFNQYPIVVELIVKEQYWFEYFLKQL